MSIKRLISLTSVALLCLGTAAGQGNSVDPDSTTILQAIKSQVIGRSMAYEYVRELSDLIGPRLTGSPQADKACQWAMAKMKQSGLQNVHLESWKLGRGWQRGHASLQLTVPFRLDLTVASYGWTGSTKTGQTEVPVALVNSDAIPLEIQKHAASWKGKVLFMAPTSRQHTGAIRAFSQVGMLLNAAAKAHAVAVIYPTGRPGSMQTHTGPAAFTDSYFSVPLLDIAPEHQQLLLRLLTEPKPAVKVKIDIQNTVTPGSVSASNVVGEITGSEHPEEVVLVCAHLDSWDLGTGSIDDATGVAGVLGAADSILYQRIKPRRTIRFVLFTGEEQGLLGSLAYVRTHRAEMKNVVCAFALDWGAGPIVKLPLAGHDELQSVFQHFAQFVSDLGDIQVDNTYLSFTDGYAFTLAGVPGIAPLQNSPNYVQVGHSRADTFDKVSKKNLIQNTAILASASFWVANYPTRLGMAWTPQQTAKALIRDNQRTLLELFGLWNFLKDKK